MTRAIMICGARALASDAQLYVRGLDGRWYPALPGTRERAKRMRLHALWIYGVRA